MATNFAGSLFQLGLGGSFDYKFLNYLPSATTACSYSTPCEKHIAWSSSGLKCTMTTNPCRSILLVIPSIHLTLPIPLYESCGLLPLPNRRHKSHSKCLDSSTALQHYNPTVSHVITPRTQPSTRNIRHNRLRRRYSWSME